MRKLALFLFFLFFFTKSFSQDTLQEYREAVKMWSKMIEKTPNNAEMYYQRGKSKYKSTDYAGALQDFNKSLELDSTNSNVKYYKGLANDILQHKPKPIKKDTTSRKFIRQFYISTTYKQVPDSMVWIVTGLIVNNSIVDNLVILYSDLGNVTDIIPTSYPQIALFCDSCKVVFGQYEDASIDNMAVTYNAGGNPMTYLPKEFMPGYRLKTNKQSLSLKVQEYKLSIVEIKNLKQGN